MKVKINFSNIFAYIQGKLRYKLYYSKYGKKLIRKHILEQIDWRISVMDKECYNAGSCKICGCDTTALQMSDKACPKPCYPKMMSKRDWIVYKVVRPVVSLGMKALIDSGYGQDVDITDEDGRYEWKIQGRVEDIKVTAPTILTPPIVKEILLINTNSSKVLDFIEDIVRDRNEATFITGEYGMVLFHRTVMEYTKVECSYDIGDIDKQVTYKIYSDRLKKTFKITVKYNPVYDDRSINWQIEETTGFPVKSSTLTLETN